MIKKLIAGIIILVIVMVLFGAYYQYKQCKDGTGGVLSRFCHLFESAASSASKLIPKSL